MKLWKYADFDENLKLSFREGIAATLLGLFIGGGLVGGWIALWQWLRP